MLVLSTSTKSKELAVGNTLKWEMLKNGEVEYFFDANGDLWKGPVSPDDNLHYARFEGFRDDGGLIWVSRRSEKPRTVLTAQDLEEFLVRRMAQSRRDHQVRQAQEAMKAIRV